MQPRPPIRPRRVPLFDRHRFRTAVHYVCWVCEDPRVLGPVKLSRVLWYADRNTNLASGEPITGATYVKRPYGPVARPLAPVLRELEQDGAIAIRMHSHGTDMEQYFAIQAPAIAELRPEHVSTLDAAIRHVCFDPHASVANRKEHDRVWRVARVGETLPHYTVFSGIPGDLSEADMDWAVREARRAPLETNWKEMEELRELNPRIEDACKAVVWYLSREPSAGVPVPAGRESVFLHKQRGHRALDVPDICVLYRLDLEELILGPFRYGFVNVEEDDEAGDDDAAAMRAG
jgi:hypothetical protein